MDQIVVTPEFLALVAGLILSLAFSYIPGLNVAYAGLSEEAKKAIMAGLLLLTSIVLVVFSCTGIVATSIMCDKPGLILLAWIFIQALIANQSIYKITPKTKAVKMAVIARDTLAAGPFVYTSKS